MGSGVQSSLVVLGSLIGAMVVSPGRVAAIVEPASQRQYVEQPAAWVPFSADIRRVNAMTGAVSVGKFYRSSEGSTRSDTGPSLDRIDTIGIKNIRLVAFYLWSDKTGWRQQPMTIPPDGWAPGKIVFNEHMTRVPERIDGLELIKHDAPPYTVFRAPQLNMFELVKLLPCQFESPTPCGTWFANVQIGEQPPELFEVPASQPVVQNPQPGGIVLRKAPRPGR